MLPKPKPTWRDLLPLASIFIAVSKMNTEDTLFMCIYAVIAMGLFLYAAWSHKEYSRGIRGVVCAFIVVTIGAVCIRNFERNVTKELERNEGQFVPSGYPPPLSKCPIPTNAFVIYAAEGAFWTSRKEMAVIGNEENRLLTIKHSPNGDVLVDAQIFDDRSNLVATITDNHFFSTSYAAYKKRPDMSTLIVYDHLNREVLNLSVLNSNAVVLRAAILYTSDGKGYAKITDQDITIPNTHISGVCAGNAAGFAIHLPR